MRVKVIKTYRDKRTGALHKAGEIIEVTRERFAEINGTSHGVFVEEIKEPQKPAKKSTKK